MRDKKLAVLLVSASLLLYACGRKGPAAPETTAAVPATEETVLQEETTAAVVESSSAEEETTEAAPAGPELAADSILAPLPVCGEAGYVGWKNMGEGAEMLVYEDTGDGSFRAYEEKLSAAGFEEYDDNEMAGNLFSTWTDGETTVSLLYMPDYDSFRIVAEPAGTLPPREEDNPPYEKICEPLMQMISPNFNKAQKGGLCLLFRLSDGSFIIVDGGFNVEECGDALYNELKELAPDPDHIVIAAWFLTHAHSDHCGAFKAFALKYADQVTLETCVYNYPSDEGEVMEFVASRVKALDQCLAMYDGVKTIETHQGQRFYIRDAVVEMIYTWEQLMPYDREIADFNDTSLVFSVELGGEKIMVLGDCGTLASPVVEELYKDYLKSDIIQVAHHGSWGATEGLNRYIGARVALWPTTDQRAATQLKRSYSEPLTHAEHMYVAHTYVFTLPLPFDPDKVIQKEIY